MSLDIYLYLNVDAGGTEPYRATLAEQNITHNVVPMWCLAGVYGALYESDGKTAGETLAELRSGVAAMESRIEECRALNPENGWGDADRALGWLRRWTAECEAYPKAKIRVRR